VRLGEESDDSGMRATSGVKDDGSVYSIVQVFYDVKGGILKNLTGNQDGQDKEKR
jgi:hypothetical protein